MSELAASAWRMADAIAQAADEDAGRGPALLAVAVQADRFVEVILDNALPGEEVEVAVAASYLRQVAALVIAREEFGRG